ncbi:hypothetical protein TNCV_2344331 [Trichonephila clavipes]|nr:hypothetical protein TNCV_2344331 [Trichonephila clavipes]
MWIGNKLNEEECRPVVTKIIPQFQCDRASYRPPDGELDAALELESDMPAYCFQEPMQRGEPCANVLRSAEAHFWLNGYVNKQNCRIWSEANSQVYVETPLHPEKLTVWCALWAGGILLQKR